MGALGLGVPFALVPIGPVLQLQLDYLSLFIVLTGCFALE